MTAKTPATTGFDLSTLDTKKACNQPILIQLKHPATGELLPAYIPVLGPDSDVFQQSVREQVNAKLRREAFLRNRGKPIEAMTVEQTESETLDLLTALIYGSEAEGGMKWIGVEWKGQPLDFTIPNIKMILTELSWIRKQIDEPLGDLQLFMGT